MESRSRRLGRGHGPLFPDHHHRDALLGSDDTDNCTLRGFFSRAQRTSRLNIRARGEAHYESTTSMSDVSFLHDFAHPRSSRPTILHIHSLPRFSSLLFSLCIFFLFLHTSSSFPRRNRKQHEDVFVPCLYRHVPLSTEY